MRIVQYNDFRGYGISGQYGFRLIKGDSIYHNGERRGSTNGMEIRADFRITI